MTFDITILGTSQAIPTAKRNHTAIHVVYNENNLLIDCGEGTQRQFRKAKINPCKLTHLLITHWHGDHILGIPGLFQTLLLNGYSKTLYVYGPRGTKYYMKKLLDLLVPYNTIQLVIKETENEKVLETKDIVVNSLSMKHSNPCNAYSISEKQKTRLKKEKIKQLKLPNSPILSKLQMGKDIVFNNKLIKAKDLTYKTIPKKITIIMDTKLNPNCKKLAKDSDLLISEAVYLNNEKDLASLHEHLTAEQAGEIAKKSKSKKLVLSHLSQRYDCQESLILREAKKKFNNTFIAEDLMKIRV